MLRKWIFAAYMACAVVTYGHAYHHQSQYVNQWAGTKRPADSFEKGAVALLACALWPLYWSQHYFSFDDH